MATQTKSSETSAGNGGASAQETKSAQNKSAGNKKNSGKTLPDVFTEQLKDIYGAEKQLSKGIAEIIKAVSTKELKRTLEEHHGETLQHAKKLESVFGMLSIDREAKKCRAMEGLLEEAQEIIDTFDEGSVRDCALIIAVQKIEHYEIAAYGSLCELAEVMGRHKAAEILDEIKEEEENADHSLTMIAEIVNDKALEEMEEPVSAS